LEAFTSLTMMLLAASLPKAETMAISTAMMAMVMPILFSW
jgi:hypothetical protein